ncbi:MAG: D-alanyl-D-alanine carboxypeptidase family protein, partial [Kovacikia sp.]
ASKWLQANAAHYSFELSYPKNNPQGVNYEPWHWRYVGDIASLKTFYRAHGGQKQLSGGGASASQ